MNGSEENQPISAKALGQESSWAKNVLPPVITTGALLLTSCAEAWQATPTTEAFTVDSASKSLDIWRTFTNGSQTGEIVGSPALVVSPDDANGAKMWSFHPANPDGSPNKDIDYGFAKAIVKTGGQDYSVTFLIKHVESAKTTTAYLLLLDTDTPTDKTYSAGEIGSDGIVHLAPFSFRIHQDAADPAKSTFTLNNPSDSAESELATTTEPSGAAAKVFDVAFKTGSSEEQPPITLTATPDTSGTAVPTQKTEPSPTVQTPPTAEAPPVVDPNAPPDGTGEKGADGLYHKTEDGVTVTWSPELQTWERILNVNNESIKLWTVTQQGHDIGFKDQIGLIVKISDKVSGFSKMESLTHHPGADVTQAPGFANQFYSDLLIKLNYLKDPNTHIQNGETFLPFATTEGSQNWKLGPDTTVEVDILDQPIGDGFQEYADPYTGEKWQVRLFTDEQGNLHEWIVLGKPVDQLTEEQLMEVYFLAPGLIIGSPDEQIHKFSNQLTLWIAYLIDPSRPPFFDFGPPQ